MSAKMGRPTDNPRPIRKAVRLSDEENKKLQEVSKETGISESDLIRQGIDKVIEESKKK